jgi:hypothetical protein
MRLACRAEVRSGKTRLHPANAELRRGSLHSPLRYERGLVDGEGLEPPTLSV